MSRASNESLGGTEMTSLRYRRVKASTGAVYCKTGGGWARFKIWPSARANILKTMADGGGWSVTQSAGQRKRVALNIYVNRLAEPRNTLVTHCGCLRGR
jgi:hypothetical protein